MKTQFTVKRDHQVNGQIGVCVSAVGPDGNTYETESVALNGDSHDVLVRECKDRIDKVFMQMQKTPGAGRNT